MKARDCKTLEQAARLLEIVACNLRDAYYEQQTGEWGSAEAHDRYTTHMLIVVRLRAMVDAETEDVHQPSSPGSVVARI